MIAVMDAESLGRSGYVVEPAFVAPRLAAALREHALARDADGAFRAAGIGRADARVERRDIRGDRILWLDVEAPAEVERPLLDALESLRSCLNATLYLGLWDFEAHYAIYPRDAIYARHRDRFAHESDGAPSRVLSFVVYLNEGWRVDDGGALRLYIAGNDCVDVMPESGTLACFLAERFEHEVLPARRPRLAVTGWFRRRDTIRPWPRRPAS
jgi:SM-20-related protein